MVRGVIRLERWMIRFHGSRGRVGRARAITVKPQQLPFVCAVGSTVYKVQGETLQAMVVMDWKSQQRVVNKPQQTYLLVSRVTSRHALVALTPFTDELAEWSKPPASALNEEERLCRLSDATLETFQLSQAADAAATAMEAGISARTAFASPGH
ncbi:hypothetical protein BBJ28_00014671 [Nothophytophthora sp. Chile5]|nr:hypothetical protein BBJ28_00014671 [Nothophytophthora sp. Chile5]